ncbi:hypothetical protein PGT21_036532 [Puccinia graminis f. sp. tritici]|uniref:Uncharacterized protein n=1 Tax=Puccinia graminis f. sp. tritici TaxID=56615 RepID=A0A5B0R4T3_PUCGR|nr:hypothetical protein PGT21_036532 [Puccinia graminis f. sp. tritici]
MSNNNSIQSLSDRVRDSSQQQQSTTNSSSQPPSKLPTPVTQHSSHHSLPHPLSSSNPTPHKNTPQSQDKENRLTQSHSPTRKGKKLLQAKQERRIHHTAVAW